MELQKACCVERSDKVISESEKSKEFRIKNPDRKSVITCRVDKCALRGASKKCDYLFLVDNELLMLLELKGTDHVRAVRQIISSAEALGVGKFCGEKTSYIVAAACPKARTSYDSELKKLAARFKTIGLRLPRKKNGSMTVEI